MRNFPLILRVFPFCISLCLAFGCQQWPVNLERLAQTCGAGIELEDFRFIQLTDTAGQNLERKANLKARWRDLSGITHELGVSEHGCVALPAASGQLELASQNPQLGMIHKIDGADSPRFQKFALWPIGAVEVDFECPLGGLYAADSLSLNSQIRPELGHNTELFRWELQAESRASKQFAWLASSDFGASSLKLADQISTRSLEANLYQLKLQVFSLLDDINQAKPLREKECPLSILRQSPQILGDLTQNFVVNPNVVLPVSTDSANALLVCTEAAADRETLAGSCKNQAPTGCLRDADFHLSTALASPSAGFARYYIKATNRAGVSSATACIEVAVDLDKPVLQLSFDEEILNPLGSGPALPFRYYRGRVIKLVDDATDPAFLEDHLECMVDFVSAKQAVSRSEAAFCRTDRCRLQLLNEWRSCDKVFDWYLNDDWERMINGTVNLRVRTKDRLDHVTEASLSLWMLDSRFKVVNPRNLPWIARNFTIAPEQLKLLSDSRGWQAVAVDADGSYWQVLRQRSAGEAPLLLHIQNNAPAEIFSPDTSNLPPTARITEIFIDRHHQIWLGLAGKDGLARLDQSTKSFTFFNAVEEGKELLESDLPLNFVEDSAGALWYRADFTRAFRFNGESIKIFSSEQVLGTAEPAPLVGPRLSRDGQIWFASAGNRPLLAQYNHGLWQNFLLPDMQNKRGKLRDFRLDVLEDRFLLASDNGIFAYWQAGVYQELPGTGKGAAPIEILPLATGSILVATRNGIYIADNRSGWKDLNTSTKVFDITDPLPDNPSWRYLRQLANGEILYMMQSFSPLARTNTYLLARNPRTQMHFTALNSGIPGARASRFLEDSKGRLWLGTKDGLGLLERDRWKTYSRFSERMPSLNILDMLEDKAANILVSLGAYGQSAGGLGLIQDQKILDISSRLPAGILPRRLALLPNGRVLMAVGADGLLEAQANQTKFTSAPYRIGFTVDVAVTADGMVYAIADGKVLRSQDLQGPWQSMDRFQKAVGDPTQMPTSLRIFLDLQNQPWLLADDQRIYHWVEDAWRDIALDAPGGPEIFSALAFDLNHSLWFDTPREIWQLAAGKWQAYPKEDLIINDTLPSEIQAKPIGAILVDRVGRVIVSGGSTGHGMLILKP